jgi:exosome complex RNA-binding protein Rrp42 (RNase PH superfamily)
MAASSFEPSRTGPYELVLSRTLDNTLRRARAIDLESLCILAKKLVWSVRVDVHFLDHDGGLVDAACVAVVASLMSFRREDVEVRGEEVKVVWSLILKVFSFVIIVLLYAILFFPVSLFHICSLIHCMLFP